jgi:hypothetical protein
MYGANNDVMNSDRDDGTKNKIHQGSCAARDADPADGTGILYPSFVFKITTS